jgi:serine/threonine protein kinase
LGRVLGKGGFSVVSELLSIQLDEVYDTSESEAKLRSMWSQHVNENRTAQVGSSTTNTINKNNINNNKQQQQQQYVVKLLRTDLPEDEHAKGIVDLAMEAEFLQRLRHCNIITMAAHANSDPHETRFFVILEKLVLTLERKLNFWRMEVSDNTGYYWTPCFGYCCAKTHVLHRLWMERLMVSRDISQAIRYLHSQKIVYRDLVRCNIVKWTATQTITGNSNAYFYSIIHHYFNRNLTM